MGAPRSQVPEYPSTKYHVPTAAIVGFKDHIRTTLLQNLLPHEMSLEHVQKRVIWFEIGGLMRCAGEQDTNTSFQFNPISSDPPRVLQSRVPLVSNTS